MWSRNFLEAFIKHFFSFSLQLDSTWVVCNRPSGEIYKDSFAGFLMALGLNGHLSSLHDYNLYSYLHEKHELTVIGLLLGLTASK